MTCNHSPRVPRLPSDLSAKGTRETHTQGPSTQAVPWPRQNPGLRVKAGVSSLASQCDGNRWRVLNGGVTWPGYN